MADPQGVTGGVKTGFKVCPSCNKENAVALTVCWKCGTVFDAGAGVNNPPASRSSFSREMIVVALVLFVLLIILAKSLPGLFSGGSKDDAQNVFKKQEDVIRKSLPGKQTVAISKKLRDELLAPVEPSRSKAAQAPNDPGTYHFLVTSLPKLLAARESRTVYFEGLMMSYLQAHDGSALLEKKELMLGDQYPAVEYKISQKPLKPGSALPSIHHAITAVVADKAYTVSADYSADVNEDGSAMKKNLLESLR